MTALLIGWIASGCTGTSAKVPTGETGGDTAGPSGDTAETGETGETGETAVLPGARWSGEQVLGDAASRTWLGEGGGGRLGRTVVAAGDNDGDGIGDLLLGAYYQSGEDTKDGRAYLLLGPLTPGEGSLADADLTVTGESETAFVSRGMAGVGDLDGDGHDDWMVGAPGADGMNGRACFFSGGGHTGAQVLSEADACLLGVSGLAGAFLVGPGDLDGDGVADVLVSAIFQGDGGSNAGSVYPISGPIPSSETSLLDVPHLTGAAEDNAGWFTSPAGDLDGDGYADAWVGAPGADVGAAEGGAVYGVRGPWPEGVLTLADAAALVVVGAEANGRAGSALAGGSDLDGDGAPDLAVGSPGAGATGGAVAVLLDPVGSGTVDLASADSVWTGAVAGGMAGWAVSMPGDLDGDGLGELWVGAYGGDAGTVAGEAYLIYGPPGAGGSLEGASARFLGGEVGDFAGWFLSGAGDVDGDGRPDLVVGAQRSDAAGEEAGRVDLLLAPEDV